MNDVYIYSVIWRLCLLNCIEIWNVHIGTPEKSNNTKIKIEILQYSLYLGEWIFGTIRTYHISLQDVYDPLNIMFWCNVTNPANVMVRYLFWSFNSAPEVFWSKKQEWKERRREEVWKCLEVILLMTCFRCYLALQSCSINFMRTYPPQKKKKLPLCSDVSHLQEIDTSHPSCVKR